MIRIRFTLLVLFAYLAGIVIGGPSSRLLTAAGLDFPLQPDVPGVWTFGLFFSLPMLGAVLALAFIYHEHIAQHFQW